jgi:hypothetical protein
MFFHGVGGSRLKRRVAVVQASEWRSMRASGGAGEREMNPAKFEVVQNTAEISIEL